MKNWKRLLPYGICPSGNCVSFVNFLKAVYQMLVYITNKLITGYNVILYVFLCYL